MVVLLALGILEEVTPHGRLVRQILPPVVAFCNFCGGEIPEDVAIRCIYVRWHSCRGPSGMTSCQTGGTP